MCEMRMTSGVGSQAQGCGGSEVLALATDGLREALDEGTAEVLLYSLLAISVQLEPLAGQWVVLSGEVHRQLDEICQALAEVDVYADGRLALTAGVHDMEAWHRVGMTARELAWCIKEDLLYNQRHLQVLFA